jgi:hypothetical protein
MDRGLSASVETGDLGAGRRGDLGTGRRGDLGTWRRGDLGIGRRGVEWCFVFVSI